jgi:hypothetical protein
VILTATFHVKNFEKFQHYKDRSPPWIKLYNETLDDYEFGRLHDASKLHLIGIWLLASRSDNSLPYDADWIGKRINATERVDLGALVASGFLVMDQPLQQVEQDASAPQAERLTREETEESREEESRAEARARLRSKVRTKVETKLNSPSITMFNRIDAWLAAGADPELDIYPAIDAGLAKLGKPPSSLKYFDGFVADNIAARKTPLAPGSARGTRQPVEIDPTERDANLWYGRLTVAKAGKWDTRNWGPHPHDPSNWIPADTRQALKDLIESLPKPKVTT